MSTVLVVAGGCSCAARQGSRRSIGIDMVLRSQSSFGWSSTMTTSSSRGSYRCGPLAEGNRHSPTCDTPRGRPQRLHRGMPAFCNCWARLLDAQGCLFHHSFVFFFLLSFSAVAFRFVRSCPPPALGPPWAVGGLRCSAGSTSAAAPPCFACSGAACAKKKTTFRARVGRSRPRQHRLGNPARRHPVRLLAVAAGAGGAAASLSASSGARRGAA